MCKNITNLGWRINYYRLRVASVIRDYGMNDREQVPADSLDIPG